MRTRPRPATASRSSSTQSGSSVLGVPFYVMVIGSPDQHREPRPGHDDARSGVAWSTERRRRPPRFTRSACGPVSAGSPARRTGTSRRAARLDQGALRAGRAHGLRQRAAAEQPRRLHPARHGAGRPRPQRPRDGVDARTEPRSRHVQMPENAPLFDPPSSTRASSHRRASAVVGLHLPPNEDAALNEISHFALDLINDVIGPGIQGRFNNQARSTATTTPTTCSSPSTATPSRL